MNNPQFFVNPVNSSNTWRKPSSSYSTNNFGHPVSHESIPHPHHSFSRDFYRFHYTNITNSRIGYNLYNTATNHASMLQPASTSSIDGFETINSLWSDFSDSKDMFQIDSLNISAVKCILYWSMIAQSNSPAFQNCRQKIQIIPKKIGKYSEPLVKNLPMIVKKFSFRTEPGCSYDIILEICSSDWQVIAQKIIDARATFSLNEMEKLMTRALNYTGNMMQPFTYLYRCKPKCYWDYTYFQGNEVLEVYQKDNNGQAASPINGKIKGLFFSARTLSDGALPPSSPFGEIRMMIPAISILDPNQINMYFSDFYCNSRQHYVTVVVCKKGSGSDSYCNTNLVKLHPDKNDFLRIELVDQSDNKSPQYRFLSNRRVWVEIYYTENIPMKWGRFDRIVATGAGTSKIGGLPHNKTCITCNLYPITASTSSEYTVKELSDPADSETFTPSSSDKNSDSLEQNIVPEKENLLNNSLASNTLNLNYNNDSSCDNIKCLIPHSDVQQVLDQVDKNMSVFSSFDQLSSQVESFGYRIHKFSKLLSEFMSEVNDDFAFQDSRIDQLQLLKQETIEINEFGLANNNDIGEEFASFIESDFEYSICENNTDKEIFEITKQMVEYIVAQESINNEDFNEKNS